MLVIDAIGAAAVGVRSVGASAPRATDWAFFGALLVSALIYTWATRPVEERRRGARLESGKVEHVDQTTIWCVAAALVLPVTLAVALVVAVAIHRYLVARKPLGLWISTTSTVALSVVSVGIVRDLFGAGTWLDGTGGFDVATGARSVVVVVASIAVYFLAAAIPVGLYRAVRFGSWDLGATLGTRADNLLIVTSAVYGIVIAVAVVTTPFCLPLAVALTIRETRQIGRVAAMAAERDTVVGERDTFRDHAFTDPLTGLLNRRAYDLQAMLALDMDQANGQRTSVLLMDLDHFKGWNTRVGHLGADKLLVGVAEVLRTLVRQGDLVARWGGEELVMVLSNTSTEQAGAIAEEIRAAVAGLRPTITAPAGGRVIVPGEDGIPACTVSIGVATSPTHGVTMTELYKAADVAVQRAKDSGRNRVVLARRLATAPVSAPKPVEPVESAEFVVEASTSV